MKDTALGEGLVTNIALGFASCYICHGGSALSNTYSDNLMHGQVSYIVSPREPQHYLLMLSCSVVHACQRSISKILNNSYIENGLLMVNLIAVLVK